MPDDLESHANAGAPSPDAIRQQLDRLIASSQLNASTSLIRFLTFTVEESLQGRNDQLKEYLIGVEVFQRGADFDPRIDPIVRVQARKLRDRLAEYYTTAGLDDAILIELPKGGYAPLFRIRQTAAPAAPVETIALAELTTEPLLEPTTPPPPKSAPSRLLYLAAAGLMIAVWVALANRNPLPTSHTMDIQQLTFDNGSAHPAVSKDGLWLVYESDQGSRGDTDIWVRPFKGGNPSRLTSHESADTTPDISPDGTLVAFRSNRDSGGIFVVPLTGGDARRIAAGGYAPRFSPDGAWVAFGLPNGIGIVPSAGGETRLLGAGVSSASFPLWSPDGKSVIFLGLKPPGEFDWWIAPFNPKSPSPPKAASTGLLDALRSHRLPAPVEHTAPADWYPDGILTSLNGSLWLIPFSHSSGKIAGKPHQVLPGPGVEFARVIHPTGSSAKLVFTVRNDNVHIWGLPIDEAPASTHSSLTQLTRDLSLKGGFDGTRPSLSADGNTLVYSSGVSGNLDIWKKDLRTGVETPVVATPLPEDRPIISPDGLRLAYLVIDAGRQTIHRAGIDGGNPTRLCENCGKPASFSPDGKLLLAIDPATHKALLIVVETGATKPLSLDPSIKLMEASFSPSGTLLGLAYTKDGQPGVHAALAPFVDGAVAAVDQWVNIVHEPFFASLHFSAGSRTVYFFSTRDNHRCLWARHIHPKTGSVSGEPFAIRHFHTAKNYPWNGSFPAVGEHRIALPLSDIVSNLWAASPGSETR